MRTPLRALVLLGPLLASCAAPAVATPSPATSPTAAAATASAQPAPATPGASATAAPTPIAASTVSPTPIALPTFVQLSVPSGAVVWALVAGTRLFRSLDRGDTWQERSVPPLSPNIQVSFVDDREGWLLSGGSPGTQCQRQSIRIWHTADGAATWSEAATAGIAETQCKDGISFVTSTTGFVSASDESHAPVLYRTTDGGRSWALTRELPDPPGFSTRAAGATLRTGRVHAFGSVLLLPVDVERQATPGRTGQVYRSLDAGASWTHVAELPYGPWPGFVTATRWVQLVVPGLSQETTDAGATWQLSPSDYGQAAPVAPQVEFGDPQVGYATVRGAIQRTVDGAGHWTRLHTPGTG